MTIVLISLLCVAMIVAGVVWGWWPHIYQWFQGGEPAPFPVKPENRGKRRHAVSTLDGRAIRPLVYQNRKYWLIGGCRAMIYA